MADGYYGGRCPICGRNCTCRRPTIRKSHASCERIRMCLAEVGLDPERMICSETASCVVGAGIGGEGLPIEVIDKLTDRAIALVNRTKPAARDASGGGDA